MLNPVLVLVLADYGSERAQSQNSPKSSRSVHKQQIHPYLLLTSTGNSENCRNVILYPFKTEITWHSMHCCIWKMSPSKTPFFSGTAIKENLVKFWEDNDIFCKEQHGFTRGRSCLTNLLETLENWTKALDEGFHTVHIQHDLSQCCTHQS